MAWQFYDVIKYTGNNYGPIPCKRWVKHSSDKKHRVSRKASGPRPYPPNAELQAVSYAEWLAARDNVALPENGRRVVFWSHIINHAGKLEKRIQKVRFGNIEIELPNWDWQPVKISRGYF